MTSPRGNSGALGAGSGYITRGRVAHQKTHADPPKSRPTPRASEATDRLTHTGRESHSPAAKKEKGPTQRRRRRWRQRRCAASRNGGNCQVASRHQSHSVQSVRGHGDAAVRLVVQLRARLPPGGRSHAPEGPRRVNRWARSGHHAQANRLCVQCSHWWPPYFSLYDNYETIKFRIKLIKLALNIRAQYMN